MRELVEMCESMKRQSMLKYVFKAFLCCCFFYIFVRSFVSLRRCVRLVCGCVFLKRKKFARRIRSSVERYVFCLHLHIQSAVASAPASCESVWCAELYVIVEHFCLIYNSCRDACVWRRHWNRPRGSSSPIQFVNTSFSLSLLTHISQPRTKHTTDRIITVGNSNVYALCLVSSARPITYLSRNNY